jgi:hypothetical protein
VGVHPGGPSAVGDGSHQPPARPQPGWTTSSDSTTSGGRSPIEDCDLARQEGVTSGEREETTVTLDSLPNQKIGSNAVRGVGATLRTDRCSCGICKKSPENLVILRIMEVSEDGLKN